MNAKNGCICTTCTIIIIIKSFFFLPAYVTEKRLSNFLLSVWSNYRIMNIELKKQVLNEILEPMKNICIYYNLIFDWITKFSFSQYVECRIYTKAQSTILCTLLHRIGYKKRVMLRHREGERRIHTYFFESHVPQRKA